jgi:hypothetical protein
VRREGPHARAFSAPIEPGDPLPSIMIIAESSNGGDAAVFLAERFTTVQLDDAHFAAQLVERLKWACEDAERAEREAAKPMRR